MLRHPHNAAGLPRWEGGHVARATPSRRAINAVTALTCTLARRVVRNVSNGNYAGLTGATLRTTAPGIGANVAAVAVNSNLGYCIEDSEDSGATYYNYVGGTPGAALQAGYVGSTIQAGTCLLAAGAAAS